MHSVIKYRFHYIRKTSKPFCCSSSTLWRKSSSGSLDSRLCLTRTNASSRSVKSTDESYNNVPYSTIIIGMLQRHFFIDPKLPSSRRHCYQYLNGAKLLNRLYKITFVSKCSRVSSGHTRH